MALLVRVEVRGIPQVLGLLMGYSWSALVRVIKPLRATACTGRVLRHLPGEPQNRKSRTCAHRRFQPRFDIPNHACHPLTAQALALWPKKQGRCSRSVASTPVKKHQELAVNKDHSGSLNRQQKLQPGGSCWIVEGIAQQRQGNAHLR